jgi:hypothetical protein
VARARYGAVALPKTTRFSEDSPVTFYNVRLYTGLIQELRGLIGRSRLVGFHYRLGGPESAEYALGSSGLATTRNTEWFCRQRQFHNLNDSASILYLE